LREIRGFDPEPSYKGLFEAPSSTQTIPLEDNEPKPVELIYEVDYDSEHAKMREKLLSYRKKS
jgi:hypothetical protein